MARGLPIATPRSPGNRPAIVANLRQMAKSLVLLTFGISLGCVGGTTECIDTGTAIAIMHTNPTGNCGSDVLAGIATNNYTPMKNLSCGVVHFNLNYDFDSGSGAACMGSNAISFQDLGSDGGSGTDVMNITCSSGVSCTETYDVTFTLE